MLQRAIAWAVGMALRLIALAPLVAIVPAAMLDSGPGSRVRFSLFPLVLTAYDPFVWTCLWNGIVLAAAVSIGATFIGVRLGWVLARTAFWTRPLLASLTIASAVVPPAFLALGLLHLFDGSGPPIWQRLVDESLPWAGYPGQSWPWLIWGWSALVQGVGLVVIATTAALSRIDSRREDAARLVGASARGVWRTLTWPAIRPAVAEAAGLVFVITLADPAAPLILGLRRTPGFQIASLAPWPRAIPAARGDRPDGPHSPPSAFGHWCGGGVGRELETGRGIREGEAPAERDLHLHVRGAASCTRAGPPSGSAGASPSRMSKSRFAWLTRTGSLGLLAAWSAVAWLPLVGLLRMGLSELPGTADTGAGLGAGVAGFLGGSRQAPAGSHLGHSVLLGLGFALTAWLLAGTLLPSRGGPRSRGRSIWLAEATASLPPVVWGIGLLAVSRVSQLVSQAAGVGAGPSAFNRAMDVVSLAFDPARFPGLALFAGVCLAMQSRRFVRWTPPGNREESLDRRVDQAILAGASPGRAYRLARRDRRPITVRRLFSGPPWPRPAWGRRWCSRRQSIPGRRGPGSSSWRTSPALRGPRPRPWRRRRSPSTFWHWRGLMRGLAPSTEWRRRTWSESPSREADSTHERGTGKMLENRDPRCRLGARARPRDRRWTWPSSRSRTARSSRGGPSVPGARSTARSSSTRA